MDGQDGIRKYVGVRFTRHAWQKLAERKVAVGQVERALQQPDRVVTGKHNRLIAERRTAVGNTIRVVFVEERTPLGLVAVVITFYREGGT